MHRNFNPPRRGASAPRQLDPVAKFELARSTLFDFIADNQEVYDRLIQTVEQYNASLKEAKDYVRSAEPTGPLKLGPFSRSRAPEAVVYAPAKLPQEVLLIPGIIKAIDTAMLETLVKAGTIPAEQVVQAKSVETGTPRVEGPKELVIKL